MRSGRAKPQGYAKVLEEEKKWSMQIDRERSLRLKSEAMISVSNRRRCSFDDSSVKCLVCYFLIIF